MKIVTVGNLESQKVCNVSDIITVNRHHDFLNILAQYRNTLLVLVFEPQSIDFGKCNLFEVIETYVKNSNSDILFFVHNTNSRKKTIEIVDYSDDYKLSINPSFLIAYNRVGAKIVRRFELFDFFNRELVTIEDFISKFDKENIKVINTKL